jgi:hypothetical protein
LSGFYLKSRPITPSRAATAATAPGSSCARTGGYGLINWLEKQSFRTKGGDLQPVTLEDILIVAPYNMQVNQLQKELLPGARIGTVDKFQGQEAEIVIVSMTTSSQEYLPRYLDFLFSRKRLNVALSRARCLAILIANPRLLETACNTVEQMGLINTLCRAYYAGISDCRTPGADLQSLESYFQFAAQVTS